MSTPVPRRSRVAAALLITAAVAIGQPGTAHAQPKAAQAALLGGSIAGYLTDGGTPTSDSAGSPIPTTYVNLYDTDFNFVTSTLTDEAGYFAIPDVPAGDYKLSFDLPGWVTQYYHQKLDFDSADAITVVDGQETTINEQVVAHGSIAGHITTPDGADSPYPYIVVYRPDGSQLAQMTGDGQGNYLVPYVPIGPVVVEVWPGGNDGRRQYVHGTQSLEQATVFDIADGVRTTVDEQLLGVGTIHGHFTDADGAPLPATTVSARNEATGIGVGAMTDDDGNYSLDVLAGTYTVEFEPPDGLPQWAHQKVLQEEADTFTVGVGDDVAVNDGAIRTGTVAGHLRDANGQPVANASVIVTDGRLFYLNATTDDEGAYAIKAFPGTYKVRFATDTQVQWAHQKTTSGAADEIAVIGGQTTVVDDSLLRTGRITVVARDADTGATVSSFCASSINEPYLYGCTTTGSVTLETGPGTYSIIVDPTSTDYQSARINDVVVTSDADTSVVARLIRSATIKVTVRDRASGAPVGNACLELVPTDSPTALGTRSRGCTGSDGKLTVRELDPGVYDAFVWANDGVHGHQWVGPNGGVGAMAEARVLNAASGSTTNLTVRLDKAGSITGVVRDRATQAPLANTIVGLASFNDGFGPTRAQVFADAQGRYRIDNLGPYQWPLFFKAANYPGQWSGGGTNRLTASAVKVRAGRTTTYDAGLKRGTILTGTVTDPTGHPITARITVLNAASRDEMGSGDTGPDGVYRVPVLGKQSVKLLWIASSTEFSPHGFYKDAADFAHAKTVVIPANRTKTINFVLLLP